MNQRSSELGTYREVVARLEAAQKSNKGAPPYSRFINRPLGRRFAALAYLCGLRPNQVTVLSAICSFTAIGLLALVQPTWWLGLLIAALLMLGYALDAADGQLARLQGGGSLSGEWLDHMVDAFKIVTLHLAVLICWYRFFQVESWLYFVPMTFVVAAVVSFFAQLLNEQLRNGALLKLGRPNPPKSSSALRSVLAAPTDYGLHCLLFALLGTPLAFQWAYGLCALGESGYLGLALVKWYKDMRQLDAELARHQGVL